MPRGESPVLDLGDQVPLQFLTTDANGNLANAGVVTLTITQPDNTTVGPFTVAPTTVGTYVYTFAPTLVGRHAVRWVATGVNASTYSDVLDVAPADPGGLISLADIKTHLKITKPGDDEVLRGFLAATTSLIEDEVGPVLLRNVVEVRPLNATIVLSRAPVVALTSVVAASYSGVSTNDVTVYYLLDAAAGLLTYVPNINGYGSLYGNTATVTYTAGRPVIPAAIQLAATLITQHMYETRRGAGAVPVRGGGDLAPMPGSGFLVPDRAVEALSPFLRSPRLG